jgi:predicted nucleic acid-binding protein
VGELVALDSSIVVILAGGSSAEPRARERAESILFEHEDLGELVGVPAPGWAECCHCDLEAAIKFLIWPLNPAAAILANRLTAPMLQAGRAAANATKREVKIDALILATAEVVGCSVLYTTDTWFADIATKERLRVKVRHLPPVRPFQATIPEIR